MIKSTHEQLKQENYFLEVEAEAQESEWKKAGSFQSIRQSFASKLAQGDEEASLVDLDQDGVAEGVDVDGDGEIDFWFPTNENAIEINQQALIDHGQESQAGIGAKDPGLLESALHRAQNYWYYEQDPFKAAAAIAHGIGQQQNIFDDGHKRTAFHQTREFLDENGYGHISPVPEDGLGDYPSDDIELADHLLGYAVAKAMEDGESGPFYDETGKEIIPRTLEDTAEMFRQRHEKWLKENGYS